MTTRGYDKGLNRGLLLDLQFREGTGTSTKDWAKPGNNPVTLTGPPTWAQLASGKNVLDFNSATPDFIEISGADSADLGFTTEDFSGCLWVNINDLSTNRYFFSRCANLADGWAFNARSDQTIDFTTYQAGAFQNTRSIAILTTGTWYFVAFTRSGNTAKIYVNGIDVTETPSSHANPLAANRIFYVGTWDRPPIQYHFDGQMGRARIWGRALNKDEPMEAFYEDRDWYGV